MEKPIFVATHPRTISTAFERIFITRPDILTCVHEPFGDAFYFGPERLSDRYEGEENRAVREETGFAETTFAGVFENLNRDGAEGKRLFIKDMAYYLFPPDGKAAQFSSSLVEYRRGVGTGELAVDGANGKQPPERGTNPTVVPDDLLRQFHFAFLIRDPRSSIPSWYRCCSPPLDKITGVSEFWPNEAGYSELRRFFDYLVTAGHVGPELTQQGRNEVKLANGEKSIDMDGSQSTAKYPPPITVIDSDEFLADPDGVVRAFCEAVSVEYDQSMLSWDGPDDKDLSKYAFRKWPGFHEDAIESKGIIKKPKKVYKSDAELFDEWKQKYGIDGAKAIQDCVAANMDDYVYLKKFATRPRPDEVQKFPN